MTKIRKCSLINGRTIDLRNANEDDAKFILGLRTDPIKSRYLSKTSSSLSDQINWMQKYQNCNDQAYFIIQNKNSNPLGCIRLYNPKGNSFEWGSWLIIEGTPANVALESTLLMYKYALSLGFNKALINVRKKNKTVLNFHKNIYNAQLVNETEIYYYFEIDEHSIKRVFDKCSKILKSFSIASTF